MSAYKDTKPCMKCGSVNVSMEIDGGWLCDPHALQFKTEMAMKKSVLKQRRISARAVGPHET